MPKKTGDPTINAQVALGRFDATPTPAEAAGVVEVLPKSAGIMPAGVAPPWAPHPDEDAQEFMAFTTWVESGLGEPHHAVARKWAWGLRKAAWQESLGTIPIGSQDARDANTLRAIQVGKAIIIAELIKILIATQRAGYPGMTLGEAARSLRHFVTLERLIGGLTTENVAVDYSGLSDEDLAHLAAIRAKVGA